MPTCDMCGKETSLIRASIEGTELNVCSNCSKHGQVLGKVRTPVVLKTKRVFIKPEQPEENIVSNFPDLLRNARNKQNLKREDFAKLLNEKDSLVQKWEQGVLVPRLEIAKKLERILGLKLIEKPKETDDEKPKLEQPKSEEPTLGDFVKIRKRKK